MEETKNQKIIIRLLNYSELELNQWYKIRDYQGYYELPYVFSDNKDYAQGILGEKYDRYISILNERKNEIIKIDLPCKFVVELNNGEYHICTYKVNFLKNFNPKNTITFKNLFEPNLLPCMDIKNDCFYCKEHSIPIKDIKKYMPINISSNIVLIDIIQEMVRIFRKNNSVTLNKYFLPIKEKSKTCKDCLYSAQCEIYNIDKCPIVILPQYKEEYYMDIIEHQSFDAGRQKGFNDCLNVILNKNNSDIDDIISDKYEDEEDIGVQGEVYNDRY